MNNKHLDTFGDILMKRVRDKAIQDWEMIISGKMKSQSSIDIRESLSSFNEEQIEIVRSLFPMVVDSTLHHFLWTLEQEKTIDLSIEVDQEVSNIKEISDGLAGELYTEDGWITRYSQRTK